MCLPFPHSQILSLISLGPMKLSLVPATFTSTPSEHNTVSASHPLPFIVKNVILQSVAPGKEKTKLSPFRYPVLLVVPPTLPHSYYVSIIEMRGLQPSGLSKCSAYTYECHGHCGMEIGVGQSSNCCAYEQLL